MLLLDFYQVFLDLYHQMAQFNRLIEQRSRNFVRFRSRDVISSDVLIVSKESVAQKREETPANSRTERNSPHICAGDDDGVSLQQSQFLHTPMRANLASRPYHWPTRTPGIRRPGITSRVELEWELCKSDERPGALRSSHIARNSLVHACVSRVSSRFPLSLSRHVEIFRWQWLRKNRGNVSWSLSRPWVLLYRTSVETSCRCFRKIEKERKRVRECARARGNKVVGIKKEKKNDKNLQSRRTCSMSEFSRVKLSAQALIERASSRVMWSTRANFFSPQKTQRATG